MEKSKIIQLLKGQDKQHAINFANYICELHAELDGNNKPANYYLHSRTEEDMADAYNKVAKEGLVFDGKHILMTKNGVCWDHVAYKNKLYSVYPESKIDIELVYEGDEFSYTKENGKIDYKLSVKNPFADKKDEKVVGGFCIIKNRRGDFITRLTTEDIEKHRALAIDSHYWQNWFQDMCKKTVIKKACKEHFEDDFKGVNEMDNENYDMTNSVSLDTKWKTAIDAITNLNDLGIYYKENEGSGADFIGYITKRKHQIKDETKEREEAQKGRLDEIKKKIDGIATHTVLKTVYDQVNNEFKGNIPKELDHHFRKRDRIVKKAPVVGIDLAKKGTKSISVKVKAKKRKVGRPKKRGRPRKKK